MKYKQYIILGIFLAIVIVGVGLWIGKGNKEKTPVKTTTHKIAPLPKEVMITLDKDGFSPKEVTIHMGDAVRWKNESGDKQTVNSDEYPTNQLHRELNFGVFANDSSVVYTFKQTGTYGYHNQFHPEQKGTIIVIK